VELEKELPGHPPPGSSGASDGKGALGKKLYYALLRAIICGCEDLYGLRGQCDKQEPIGVTAS